MKPKITSLLPALSCLFILPAGAQQWTAEQANTWKKTQPWRAGSNFAPSTAINQLEMWQADTFDPETIDRELGYAASCGMNCARVFLHNLLWEQDSEGLLKRVDQFLAIADKGTVQGDLDIAKYITVTRGSLAGKILLIDDLADSGVTLMKVIEHLKANYKDVEEVRSAVIWTKGSSAFKPDYQMQELPHNPWIHQPFEDYDGLRPHQLAAWLKKGEQSA